MARSTHLGRFARRVLSPAFLEGFIPPGVRDAGEDAVRRARVLVMFWQAMLPWPPIFALLYHYWLASTAAGVTCALGGVVILVIPLILRYSGSITLAGNVAVIDFVVILTVLAFLTGGQGTPAQMWLVITPLVAVCMAGIGSGLVWTMVILLEIMLFHQLGLMGFAVSYRLGTTEMELLTTVGLAGLTVVVLSLAVVYESQKNWVLNLVLQRERALVEAKDAAEAANRAKSAFLANMSHEIRTPMTAVLGYLDLISDMAEQQRSAEGQMLRGHVDVIRHNGEHLLRVISDILDLSKIEAGKTEITLMEDSPARLAAEVESLGRVWASQKGLAFELECLGPLPQLIRTDPIRMRQVLLNLVGNAIKFTESGRVCLIVRLVDTNDGPRVEFEVADTGIGMTAEQIERLFKPFSQGDESTSRKYGGTGLGLAISQRLIDLLGGTIRVISEPGVGSRFIVAIPSRPLEVESQAAGSREPASSASSPVGEAGPLEARILLAEDGPENQRLITAFLERAGAQVSWVSNGRLAVDRAWQALLDARPFDLILMDMQMPEMDGYEATRELRRRGYSGRIAALTAHAMAADRENCLRAGCDAYASKPIDRRGLIAMVRQLLTERTSSAAV